MRAIFCTKSIMEGDNITKKYFPHLLDSQMVLSRSGYWPAGRLAGLLADDVAC